MNNIIKYLVLWVASDCNLKCKYCYAFPNFSHGKMKIEIAKKAIKACKNKNFTLIFAGGEPLLNFQLIEEVYDFLKQEGYNCKLGLQTNGTLITSEIAQKLKDMNINVGVSFDCSLQTNDFFRKSSKKVLEGVEKLREVGKIINLNSVLTSKSVVEMEKFIEMSYYFGNVGGVGIDLLRLSSYAMLDDDVKLPNDEDIYINLKKAYIKSKNLGKLFGKEVKIREIEELRYRKEKGHCSDGYCYSSLAQAMVVDVDGNIYPCSSLVGDKRYLCGNINEIDTVKIIALNSGKVENCKSCKYQIYCKGCCPARMIYNTPYNKNQDCVLRKAIFRILEEEKNGEENIVSF